MHVIVELIIPFTSNKHAYTVKYINTACFLLDFKPIQWFQFCMYQKSNQFAYIFAALFVHVV